MRILLVLFSLVFSSSAFSYAVTTDQAAFYSMYSTPSEIIDFTKLKDGTAFGPGLLGTTPLINEFSTSGPHYDVWEYGWSNNFLLRTRTGPSSYVSVTRWYGDYVTPDLQFSRILSLLILADVGPVALDISSDTYSGFLGFVPESGTNDEIILFGYDNLRLNEIKIGFSAVPIPATLVLLLIGLLAIGVRGRPTR